jgi:integrase
MCEHAHAGMSLYGPTGGRKYLNAAERRRFIKAANRADPETRLFCLVLGWSGGRISEVLALTPAAIDIESGVASIETLKRRRRGIVRQVPLPPTALHQLDSVFGLRRRQRDPLASASGRGAGRPPGGESRTSWPQPEFSARPPCRGAFAIRSASMPTNPTCHRTWCNVGSAMPRYATPRSTAT